MTSCYWSNVQWGRQTIANMFPQKSHIHFLSKWQCSYKTPLLKCLQANLISQLNETVRNLRNMFLVNYSLRYFLICSVTSTGKPVYNVLFVQHGWRSLHICFYLLAIWLFHRCLNFNKKESVWRDLAKKGEKMTFRSSIIILFLPATKLRSCFCFKF